MTTMITGAGLVGSQIARILVQQGEKPVLFDIAPNHAALADVVEVDKVTLFRGDLLNPFDLGKVINENRASRASSTPPPIPISAPAPRRTPTAPSR